MKKVSVIGSGFSSLASACYLAKAGYQVTVFEKNSTPGGRARQYIEGGFTFDIGPTWYWMPDVFEKFFADFGKKPSDYYGLSRLDPSYRIYYSGGKFIDLPTDPAGQEALFESLEPGSGLKLRKFMKLAAKTYKIAVGDMVYKPGLSPLELVSVDTIRHLNLFTHSIRKLVRRNFKHPYLVKLLEFPVLFLGAKPGDIPAFYNFMNYADLGLGTWYPDGGMYSVVEGMVKLAQDLGVHIETNAPVSKIITAKGGVDKIEVNGQLIDTDFVVSGADYHHTEKLLRKEERVYSESYWDKRVFAPSALLFFVGVSKKLQNMQHHTLFFDEEFDPHAASIYDHPEWPEKPLFYASCSSMSDTAVAPVGKENLTLLIPLAPGIEDTPDLREKYFQMIISRLEQITGNKINDQIEVKKSYCINDFIEDYHSYKGNAYGLANTLMQTSFLRPGVRSKKVKNLFFTGQLTVPGPGVPPSLISGKIAAEQVIAV
jgi:phytoene desaturase